jgi:Flp pilus assembly protein TadG
MMLLRIADRCKSVIARFGRAERGNVAMMFAVILPVLITSVGAAIDYARASKVRTAMQSAADATALMISKEAANLTPAQITSKSQTYFNAIFNSPEVPTTTFNAVYTANSGAGASIKIDVTASMTADILKLTVPMSASSTTKWGNIRYRVALALDNTGSMASANKMTELKTAATKLINDFHGMAGTNEDVYISIVPFAKDVRIGASYKDESWVRWTEWDNVNGSCSGWNGWNYQTKTACQNAGRTWTVSNHNTWNGCVMDRDENYDTTSTTPSSSTTATMVPAEQYGDCPVQMMPMTSVKGSKQSLLDKITAMAPDGGTNQQIGMFWAWQTLLLTGPFAAPAKDANYVYQDVLILLTDGLNTMNRFYGNGYQHSPQVDARQKILCTNARTQGIKIFAIQVATNGDPIATETKNCTSEPDNPNYFSYITQASQMTVKFDAIFKELAKLRVAM